MNYNELLELKRAVPFVPFRIVLKFGDIYDIHFPDMILGTPTRVHIEHEDPTRPPEFAFRTRIVGWEYVDRIEKLEAASDVGG